MKIWMPGLLREHTCQFVGYVKGAARACTLLAVCKLCIDAKVDVLLMHPTLADSMKKVPSRMSYAGPGDRKIVAFMNARLSAKGSITEKHTVLTWAVTLRSLITNKPGSDASSILGEWNKQATPDSAFTGQKRVGLLKFLQHCDEETVRILTEHHSKMGQHDFVFTDDCFSNIKLFPGH